MKKLWIFVVAAAVMTLFAQEVVAQVGDDSWKNDTCDMRALRDAIGDGLLFDGAPQYGINDFSYYREMYNENCEGWCDALNYYMHSFPMKGGGFKVYTTYEFDSGWPEDAEGNGFVHLSAYIYKDDEATEVELDPGLDDFEVNEHNVYVNIWSVLFLEDSIVFLFEKEDPTEPTRGVVFKWDGETMKKTHEGVIDEQ